MRNQQTKTVKRSVALFAALAITATGLMAQVPGKRMRGEHRGKGAERMAAFLNLNEAQKVQAKTIFESARQTSAPIRSELKEGRKALAEAVKTGRSDAEIQALADQQGRLMGQVAGIHAKAKAQFYATLSPEQKAKAEELGQRMKDRFKGRKGGMKSWGGVKSFTR
jgi:Spy/CpxP family protein refolding chaperone